MKRIYIFLFYGHDKYANRTQTLYEYEQIVPRTVVGQFGGFYVLLSLLEVTTTIDV